MTIRIHDALATVACLMMGALNLGAAGPAVAQTQTPVQTPVQAETQVQRQNRSHVRAPGAPGAVSGANATGAPLPPDDSLFRALGGEEGIHRVINDLVDRAIRDPRIVECLTHHE